MGVSKPFFQPVTIVVFLGLAISIDAWAGGAGANMRSPEAAAVRCFAELEGPEGIKSTVPGWGNTANEAVKAADSAARYLAEMHRVVNVWPAVLLDAESPSNSLSAVYEDWRVADPADVKRLPGYSVRRGDCQTVETPKNTKWWWSVQWADATIDGRDLGPTIERVRRRSCGRDFQRKRMSLVSAIERSSSSERAAGFQAGLSVAYKQLSRCYQVEEPTEIIVSRRRFKPMDDSDLFVCIGEPPGIDTGGPVQVAHKTPAGVGSSVEAAAESAWRSWRLALHRRALGLALQAHVKAAPENRQSVVMQAFSQTFEDIGASAALEDATTWCWTVPDDSHKVWSWEATAPGPFECAPAESQPATSETALSIFQLHEQRENLCTVAAWAAVDAVYEAADQTDEAEKDTVLSRGWSSILGCESECLMNSSVGSDGFNPVDLGGYESAKEAWAALADAIDSGEVGQIAAIITDIATSRGLEIMLVEEEAFLQGLRDAKNDGRLKEKFEASLNKGRWTIHMKSK
jgi:hypothetical protein